ACAVHDLLIVQVPPADGPEQPLDLVNGKNGRCRIVDRLGQRPDRDIHDNAESEGRVLLDGSLWSERYRSPQTAFVAGFGIAIDQKNWFAHGDEATNPGYDLDYAVGALCLDDQGLQIHRENDGRSSLMTDGMVGRSWRLALCRKRISVFDRGWINALDDRAALFSHEPHDAHRAQQSRGVIDHE